MSLLHEIQKDLKAPKGQTNKFGGYQYRSCEDIVEAVKKLLPDGATLVLTDDIVECGGRVYVKATATLSDKETSWQASAFAREALQRKGFGEDQLTGAASSYARKYALNGLFCIDDTKDSDTDEVKNQEQKSETKQQPVNKVKPPLSGDDFAKLVNDIKGAETHSGFNSAREAVRVAYDKFKPNKEQKETIAKVGREKSDELNPPSGKAITPNALNAPVEASVQ